jgi:hypothetical protein
MSLHQVGHASASDLRPDRRPVSCVRGTDETAGTCPRPGRHRALPAPRGSLVATPNTPAGPGPSLRPVRDPSATNSPARSLPRGMTLSPGPALGHGRSLPGRPKRPGGSHPWHPDRPCCRRLPAPALPPNLTARLPLLPCVAVQCDYGHLPTEVPQPWPARPPPMEAGEDVGELLN